MLNEVFKSCEKSYLFMLKLIKQCEIKKLVAVSYKFVYGVLSKLEIQCKKESEYFSLNFSWYFILFDIVHSGGVLLNEQKLLSMKNVIC